ncbi:replication initiator protein A [Azospirillum sp. sgz302134]
MARGSTQLVTLETDRQLTLPLLDSPLTGSVKGERTLMTHNFFSLSRERVTKMPPFNDGRVTIEIKSNEDGVATIWDKELLLYCASLIQEKINRGEEPQREINFKANDFLAVTGAYGGGSAYSSIVDALKRLKGTTITTNQFPDEDGSSGEKHSFSWIDDYKFRYTWRNTKSDGKEKVLSAIRVELSKTVLDAIKRGIILTYNKRYFELTSPIERRLYEIARAHCGEQVHGFRIGLEKLRQRIGSERDLRKFKADLVDLSERKTPLPDYSLVVLNGTEPARKGAGRRTPLNKVKVFFFKHTSFSDIPTIQNTPIIE